MSEKISLVIDFLKGKKTYISAIAIALVTLAHGLGWIDADASNTLIGLFGASGLASLRNAIPVKKK